MSKSKVDDFGFLEVSSGVDPVVEYVLCAHHVPAAKLAVSALSLSMAWMDIERTRG